MLFDIGWPELLLIGVVALVVIGPKDLPRALKIAGFWVRKARTLSREFQSSIDQMIRDAELDEVRQELKKASEFDIEKEIRNTVDPAGELAASIKPPDVPDYFGEAEGPTPAAEAAPDAPAALMPPAETPLPEQATLPFDEPETAAAGGPEAVPELSDAAAVDVDAPSREAEPAPASSKP